MRIVTALFLLLFLPLSQTARADGPMLAVLHIDGVTAVYPVSGIQRIVFSPDSLAIVTNAETDTYGLSAIQRIEFLWEYSGVEDPEAAPRVTRISHLFQNSPNPFAPQTRIAFDLPSPGWATLAIYGADGRFVRQLLSEHRAAGPHSANWDGRDDAGKKVASGTYFYRLQAPGVEESLRMILLP